MKTVIIGDMHNRQRAVQNLFEKLGLMNEEGDRVPGFNVISLGDIVSLGYGEKEVSFFKWVMPYIDLALIGNHEYPVINADRTVVFSGWQARDLEATELVRESIETTDKWHAATHVGKWLLTHAGLNPSYMDAMDHNNTTARDMAYELQDDFDSYRMDGYSRSVRNPMFDGISWNRGGVDSYGGIFWNDISDLVPVYENNPELVPQIVGHSSYAELLDNYPKFSDNLYCIDTKGSVNALVTEDDGKSFEFVQSDYEYEYGQGRVRGKSHLRTIK